MKTVLFFVLLTLITSAQARQYIQCSDVDSWDRAVINLDGENSTLFMTNGVHLPDEVRVLKKLYFEEQSLTHIVYTTNDGPVIDQVIIPLEVIGQYATNFPVIMKNYFRDNSHAVEREMYCFAAIYND